VLTPSFQVFKSATTVGADPSTLHGLACGITTLSRFDIIIVIGVVLSAKQIIHLCCSGFAEKDTVFVTRGRIF